MAWRREWIKSSSSSSPGLYVSERQYGWPQLRDPKQYVTVSSSGNQTKSSLSDSRNSSNEVMESQQGCLS